MEDNQTFNVCCSMVCMLVFVEQNKVLCTCNKYGCQWESSYGSMCANGHQFQTPFIWASTHNYVQLHSHNTKHIIVNEPLCLIIVLDLTLWFYGIH
jgi:hypothetical protein